MASNDLIVKANSPHIRENGKECRVYRESGRRLQTSSL